MNILLIDDEAANLAFLLVALQDYGFQIYTAQNGTEGLKLAVSKQPDLILLDINMPGMDGFEVCQTLKADTRTTTMPVIFLTATEDIDNKIKGFQFGAVDFLIKPVALSELYARITVHLNQHKIYHNLRMRVEAYQQRFGTLEQNETLKNISQRHLQQVEQARALLLQNIHNPPKLPELALKVGSNPHKLTKDFQLLYGLTVFGWLREHCLQEAAILLRETDLNIKAIAYKVGYSNHANFSTAFKKRFGLGPREYRMFSPLHTSGQ